ncbi:hypothetical protein LTR84_000488 [Exophiala bonariae]|uniref:BTB domain-containing protein n=1 Tax=Exophiala bonariae TaxID=1690606 RepID=A0AAV9NSG9_9EURO|nr:hypothetical protein LTR84_000488 [Exophiala bonariae]
MTTSEQSEFPKFRDGNVFIMISTTQTYRLHQQVLESHSTFFKKEIAKYPGAHLNAAARRNNAPQYHFEWLEATSDNDNGRFVRLEVSNSGRTLGSTPRGPRLINGKVDKSNDKAWDWVFGLFYSRAPVFDSENLQVVLDHVISMIECAEIIGSEKFIYQTADLALLRHDNVLWTSILGAPAVWIEFACRLHSPSIFTEAAIHLVGQWETLSDAVKEGIPKSARLTIAQKARELSIVKEAVELRILGHYPAYTTRKAAQKPGRPSYANDIYMWMCIGFFRQWFAQCISDDRTRRAPDGGLNIYCAIAEGGQAYLSHLDFQEFHRYFPMSIKATHVLEAHMGVLKKDLQAFVEPLIEQNTHLKRGAYQIHWLTCAKIEKMDFPWYSPYEGKHDALEDLYKTLEEENARMDAMKRADAGFEARTEHDVENEPDDLSEMEEDEGTVDDHAMRLAQARAGKKRARDEDDYEEESQGTDAAGPAGVEVSLSRVAAASNNVPITHVPGTTAPVIPGVELAAFIPVDPRLVDVTGFSVEPDSADNVVPNAQANGATDAEYAQFINDAGDAEEDGDGDEFMEDQD